MRGEVALNKGNLQLVEQTQLQMMVDVAKELKDLVLKACAQEYVAQMVLPEVLIVDGMSLEIVAGRIVAETVDRVLVNGICVNVVNNVIDKVSMDGCKQDGSRWERDQWTGRVPSTEDLSVMIARWSQACPGSRAFAALARTPASLPESGAPLAGEALRRRDQSAGSPTVGAEWRSWA
ncbi:hypothetical protein NDU88_001202 [Pleurodeles waltl]|uniref:Uncharacterized protein n=1 Tax=Pleurodeles waltl TaxID=8319 RepID=A0AAV7S6S5_PLEWA|nr:hypothetical protein NDU88_001202 [Pleurodeles waltl]